VLHLEHLSYIAGRYAAPVRSARPNVRYRTEELLAIGLPFGGDVVGRAPRVAVRMESDRRWETTVDGYRFVCELRYDKVSVTLSGDGYLHTKTCDAGPEYRTTGLDLCNKIIADRRASCDPLMGRLHALSLGSPHNFRPTR
jgi:hypothetical protein